MCCRSPTVFLALAVCGLLVRPTCLAATVDQADSGKPVGQSEAAVAPSTVNTNHSAAKDEAGTGHGEADHSNVPDHAEPESATQGDDTEPAASPGDRDREDNLPPGRSPTAPNAQRTIDPATLAQQTRVDVNMILVLGVALLAALLLLLVMWLILRGTGSRTKL